MSFKKLLLSTAIATASTASFAMEAMDDSSLSETTGQDGLTVIITPNASAANNVITSDIYLHDRDGVSGISTTSGSIVIDGFALDLNGVNSVAGNVSAISLWIDATGDHNGATIGGSAMLNIGVTLPASTTISTGTILVGASLATSFGAGAPTGQETVLSNMNITLVGQTSFNIQLGQEEQGAMIKFSTSITNGIVINNFALEDANSGGSINAVRVAIEDNGGANLTTSVNVDAASNGLILTLTGLGHSTGGLDLAMSDVGLGTTTSIGDVEVVGLNLNGTTIRILGH
jgi:hypothetical protein